MNDFLYKHVLFKDLLNYIKRTDYFEGYTPTEKAWIRKNLGINNQGTQEGTGVKKISYSDIQTSIYRKELIPGFIYIIDDFLTIYLSYEQNKDGKYITYGNVNHPSKKYSLVTIAYDEDKILSNVCIISDNPKSMLWDVKYDITLETLDDGLKTKGKIIYLKDDNGNEASYDFKNIIGRYGYTFKDYLGNENSNNCKCNLISGSNINLTGNCSYNVIRGNNVLVNYPMSNFIGELNNVSINTNIFNNETMKTSVLINNVYNIDYLDLETLTHLFYALQ